MNTTVGSTVDVGASVKKRVEQFDRYTALPPPTRPLHDFDWEDIITYDSVMLGRGSFSCVHSVRLHNCPGRVFALKQLSLSSPSVKHFKRGAIDIALEGKLLSYLNHNNIIGLHGVKKGDMQESINNKDEPFFLVLDYLTETLEERLERWRGEESAMTRIKAKVSGFDEKLFHRIETAALGIAYGMEYLHSVGVIFRDLKPENLGFDSNGTIKIFDFGVARDLNYVKRAGDKLGFTGTPRYMAIEIGAGLEYGLPADVYSFGVLLHQICTLKQPYAHLKSIDAFRVKVVNGGERPKLSLVKHSELRTLIAKCWDAVAENRPSFTEVRIELQTILSTERSLHSRALVRKASPPMGTSQKRGIENLTNVTSTSSCTSMRRSSMDCENIGNSTPSAFLLRQHTFGI